MKELYLVRHAKAEDKGIKMTDFDRRLTEKGQNDAELIGKHLQKLSVKPDFMITSPAKRTQETCGIIAELLKYPSKEVEFEIDLFEADLRSFLNVIRSIDEKYTKVMIFGHNPSISDTARYLCPAFLDGLSKGSVAAMSFQINQWQSISDGSGKKLFHETPKNLKR